MKLQWSVRDSHHRADVHSWVCRQSSKLFRLPLSVLLPFSVSQLRSGTCQKENLFPKTQHLKPKGQVFFSGLVSASSLIPPLGCHMMFQSTSSVRKITTLPNLICRVGLWRPCRARFAHKRDQRNELFQNLRTTCQQQECFIRVPHTASMLKTKLKQQYICQNISVEKRFLTQVATYIKNVSHGIHKTKYVPTDIHEDEV